MTSRWVATPFGVAFGVLLVRGQLPDPAVIRSMLLLREPDVFLLIVAGVGAHALRAAGTRALVGAEPISWTRTRPTRDHVIGSVIFGVGWSLACTCPGPIAAQLGSGQLAALFTTAGLMLGVILRGSMNRLNVRSEVAVGA